MAHRVWITSKSGEPTQSFLISKTYSKDKVTNFLVSIASWVVIAMIMTLAVLVGVAQL